MKSGYKPANGLPLELILEDGDMQCEVAILHSFILYMYHFIRFADWEAFQYEM